MKVIGSRSGSQEQKSRKSLFSHCQTAIARNSGSIKDRAMSFALSMGFSETADQMVWPPSLSRDRKWPRVAKCTHSRVLGLYIRRQLCYWRFYFGGVNTQNRGPLRPWLVGYCNIDPLATVGWSGDADEAPAVKIHTEGQHPRSRETMRSVETLDRYIGTSKHSSVVERCSCHLPTPRWPSFNAIQCETSMAGDLDISSWYRLHHTDINVK